VSNNSKNVKEVTFWISKENVKNVRKLMHSFTDQSFQPQYDGIQNKQLYD